MKSFRAKKVIATGIESMARGKVTKFTSGDDLEGYFTMAGDGKEKTTSEQIAEDVASNKSNVKPKKKQDPKWLTLWVKIKSSNPLWVQF
ncbi:hypothetical protein Ccrd_002993 [Cynara cardunculus var. scolymus]|uniref:Uncharacterized protein n=1 Tax=Cynara cardunculus var. scolymus TaxID=59895 RepID=A0A103XQK1_CYNCS|nr:hypothetical protein Ccrd_002993 [Cynara cardunculus var. scolymus]